MPGMSRTGIVAGALCMVVSAMAAAAPSGKDLHREVVASIGVYPDPELTMYVAGLVDDIIGVSEMSDERFTFTLLDSPDVNAFATKGNYVYVNRGLLNYVRNEAQLVSVLAHEVGHVTKGHVNEMQSAAGGAKMLSWLAAFLSGSPDVYEAGMAYANSLIKGHGRANELEADEAGATYMATLGYDPDEIISMLSIMKDMEALQKQRAGGQRTYHGIFASHPRNDMRLRSAVSKAEKIESSGTRDSGEARYRVATEGMIWGENFQEKEKKPERYADLSLRVRFDFPDGWTHSSDAKTKSVTGAPQSGEASLVMKPHARTAQTPEEYLYNHLNLAQLRDGQEISPARLKGYTGILPGENGQPDQRIAVVYYKMNAYLFTGQVDDMSKFREFDEAFLASVETFRPVSNREQEGQSPKKIHYVKATSATTFDALGQALKLDQNELDDLRLINGYWPAGEPQPGEWIKIFKQ